MYTYKGNKKKIKRRMNGFLHMILLGEVADSFLLVYKTKGWI